MQDDIIKLMLDYSIVLFLYYKLFSCCRLLPAVFSRPSFIVLIKKVTQDLKFIWLMSRAMDRATYFRSILRMVYTPFSALVSALTHFGVSSWWGVYYSNFPADTTTVGISPNRFFIRRFYDTFINILWYFHTFKHVYRFF